MDDKLYNTFALLLIVFPVATLISPHTWFHPATTTNLVRVERIDFERGRETQSCNKELSPPIPNRITAQSECKIHKCYSRKESKIMDSITKDCLYHARLPYYQKNSHISEVWRLCRLPQNKLAAVYMHPLPPLLLLPYHKSSCCPFSPAHSSFGPRLPIITQRKLNSEIKGRIKRVYSVNLDHDFAIERAFFFWLKAASGQTLNWSYHKSPSRISSSSSSPSSSRGLSRHRRKKRRRRLH